MHKMNTFEKHLSDIDSEISVQKKDREVYTKDFDIIRNYLLDIMQRQDAVFEKIYAGPSLFGSYFQNERIDKPDEFDVHFLLKLPFYQHIKVKRDNARPGYVKILLSKVLLLMKEDVNLYYVYEQFITFVNEWKYLCRNKLQNWLEEIITDALEIHGDTVRNSTNGYYQLIYLKRGTAHTIKAISDSRQISIDFVPALKFDARNEWLVDRPFPENVREKLWFAVPKPTVGPKSGRFLTFSVCVPQIEKELLMNKYNLKVSLRLFKSLRDKIRGYKLKSYFIRNLYLYENNRQPNEFWLQPPGYILLHMIDRLLIYLENERLPFYWSPSMNLIHGLREDQILHLKEGFEDIKSILDSYYHQPQINYDTVRRLFGKESNDEDTFAKPLKKEYA